MSIINDALKKVQKNLEQKKQMQENKPSTSSEPQEAKPERSSAPLQGQQQTAQTPRPTHGYLQGQEPPAIKQTPSANKESPASPDAAKPIPSDHGYKKDSAEKTNVNEVAPPPPPPTTSQNDDQPQPKKKIPALVIVLCFLFLSLTVAIGIRLFNQPKIKNASGNGQLNEEAMLLGLKLDGTMMMSNKNVALINGEIYEVGDALNGMIIKKISLDTVELEDKKGGIKTLKSK